MSWVNTSDFAKIKLKHAIENSSRFIALFQNIDFKLNKSIYFKTKVNYQSLRTAPENELIKSPNVL